MAYPCWYAVWPPPECLLICALALGGGVGQRHHDGLLCVLQHQLQGGLVKGTCTTSSQAGTHQAVSSGRDH